MYIIVNVIQLQISRSRVSDVCLKAEFLPTIVANSGPRTQHRRGKQIQNVTVVNVPPLRTYIMVSSLLSFAHSASLGQDESVQLVDGR